MLQQIFALMLRSLRVDARHKRFHLLRLGLGGIIVFSVFFVQYVLMQSPMQMSSPGLTVFKWIVWTNTLFAVLVGPLVFGASITEEKEERTLALLRIANVRPLSILTGKAVPLLISMLLVLAVQFPFTLLAITLGGVTIGQVVAAFASLTAFLVFAGMLSTLCSVVFRQTGNAVGAAGMLLALFFFGPWLSQAMLGGIAQMTTRPWLASAAATGVEWARYCTRLSLFTRIGEVTSSGFDEGPFGVQVMSNLLLGSVLFGLSWLVFDLFNAQTESVAPTRRRRTASGGARSARPRRPRRVWAAALAWRDFYYLAGGRTVLVAKVVGYGVIAVLFAILNANFDWRRIDLEDTGAFLSGIVFFCFLPAEITMLLARTFRTEIKEKTLTSLTMVPLSTAEMAYGKLAGSLLALLPALAYLCLGLLLAPQVVWEMFKGMAEEPLVSLLVIANVVTQALLFFHLATYFSILWNTWAGIGVAAVVHYFGATITTVVTLMFLMAVIGPAGAGDELGYILSLLAAVVATGLIVALHLGIGYQLQRKAAEL